MSDGNDVPAGPLYGDADYHPLYTNWYNPRPYNFEFTDKSGKTVCIILPISPSNLMISTPFATNIVPTLYGTVEEHSPVRYYDISIEGTTGMGPKYVFPFEKGSDPLRSTGRSAFTVKTAMGSIPVLSQSGLFKNTSGAAQNVIDGAKSLFGLEEESSGLQLDQTGYIAFHNLYRFLLKYKKDTASTDSTLREGHPLVFVNRKDHNRYRVVVKSFTMKRDKEDPMLYYYSIVMRGYDLSQRDGKINVRTAKEQAAALGLNGISGSSVLQQVKKKAEQAKAILASISGGVSQLGS
jgi:hypothetical protein